jgi:hypothetical protein
LKTLRIFISAPENVRAERARAHDVLQRLRTKFQAFINIELISSEDDTTGATQTSQAETLPPSKADIVLCILRVRSGMPLELDDLRPSLMGTQSESEQVYDNHVVRGVPDLVVFQKTAPPRIQAESDEWQHRKKALDLFLDQWRRDNPRAFEAGFKTFHTEQDFAAKLEQRLEQIIDNKVSA